MQKKFITWPLHKSFVLTIGGFNYAMHAKHFEIAHENDVTQVFMS